MRFVKNKLVIAVVLTNRFFDTGRSNGCFDDLLNVGKAGLSGFQTAPKLCQKLQSKNLKPWSCNATCKSVKILSS